MLTMKHDKNTTREDAALAQANREREHDKIREDGGRLPDAALQKHAIESDRSAAPEEPPVPRQNSSRKRGVLRLGSWISVIQTSFRRMGEGWLRPEVDPHGGSHQSSARVRAVKYALADALKKLLSRFSFWPSREIQTGLVLTLLIASPAILTAADQNEQIRRHVCKAVCKLGGWDDGSYREKFCVCMDNFPYEDFTGMRLNLPKKGREYRAPQEKE